MFKCLYSLEICHIIKNLIKMKSLKTAQKQIFTLLLFVLGFSVTFSQNSKLISAESKMTVDGTSNLHDWTITAKTMSGKADFTVENGVLKDVNSLDFAVDVDQLKSGKDGMDENTMKAMNAKVYKNVTFKMTKLVKIIKTSDGYTVDTQGTLSMAGSSKTINQTFAVKLVGKKVVLSGKQKIDMTLYGIKPPKALFGTIKTGKDVTVDFKVTFD